MPNYKFYCVARGVQPGIYTSWSECNLQVYKYSNAVHQGCHTIDQAVAFLIVGQAFVYCHNIPVYGESGSKKTPKDFGHLCINEPCSNDLDPIDENISCSFDNYIHNVDANTVNGDELNPSNDPQTTNVETLCADNEVKEQTECKQISDNESLKDETYTKEIDESEPEIAQNKTK